METYRHIPGFVRNDELLRLRRLVTEHQDLFIEVHGRGGLGPRYRVIDGDQIREQMPQLLEFGAARVLPLAEDFAGDGPGRKPNRFRDWVARRLNY